MTVPVFFEANRMIKSYRVQRKKGAKSFVIASAAFSFIVGILFAAIY
jgi:hypothetical protein